MQHTRILTVAAIACLGLWASKVSGQSDESQPFRRLTSNAGFSVSVPVSTAANYMTPGWGFIYGAGYNINKHHAFLGEATWNQLYASDRALEPIRVATENTAIKGHGNLFVLAANYRLQFEGRALGLYLLGGGGMYYRDASLSQQVATGRNTITCNQVWLWWGFTCSSGFVTQNQILAHTSSIAPGGSVGIGITIRVPDFPYRFYVETRYHYSANKIVHTQLIPITVGLRF
jgi:Outer membrane protein beta-barrel domain